MQKSKQEPLGLLSIGSLLPSDLHPEENHKAAADWERVNKAASVSEDTYMALHAQTIHAAWDLITPETVIHS